MAAQREISEKIGASRIGSVLDCIVDGPTEARGFDYDGRTRLTHRKWMESFYTGPSAVSGPIVPVRIVRADDYDLFGEIAG